MQRQFSGERITLSTSGTGTTGQPCAKKRVWSVFEQYTKVKTKINDKCENET